jgi:hypothetical protein
LDPLARSPAFLLVRPTKRIVDSSVARAARNRCESPPPAPRRRQRRPTLVDPWTTSPLRWREGREGREGQQEKLVELERMTNREIDKSDCGNFRFWEEESRSRAVHAVCGGLEKQNLTYKQLGRRNAFFLSFFLPRASFLLPVSLSNCEMQQRRTK